MLQLSSNFSKKTFKVGTRDSSLALAQTTKIIDMLKEKTENIEYEILTPEIITNKLLNRELPDIGALSNNKKLKLALDLEEIDFIVHSMKDVSKNLASQYIIGCVCLRQSCEDVVIIRDDIKKKTLNELPHGSIIGTSSLRRMTKFKKQYPQHEFVSIKGDLDKRIEKLDNPDLFLAEGQRPYSALILAKTGLIRLNLQDRISQEFLLEDSFYAAGQGAIACECQSNDEETLTLLSLIKDEKSTMSCIAERSLMKTMDCRASEAIAVQSVFTENEITLRACVSSIDGTKYIEKGQTINLSTNLTGTENDHTEENDLIGISIWGWDKVAQYKMLACKKLGENVANLLLSSNANEILKENHAAKRQSRTKRHK